MWTSISKWTKWSPGTLAMCPVKPSNAKNHMWSQLQEPMVLHLGNMAAKMISKKKCIQHTHNEMASNPFPNNQVWNRSTRNLQHIHRVVNYQKPRLSAPAHSHSWGTRSRYKKERGRWVLDYLLEVSCLRTDWGTESTITCTHNLRDKICWIWYPISRPYGLIFTRQAAIWQAKLCKANLWCQVSSVQATVKKISPKQLLDHIPAHHMRHWQKPMGLLYSMLAL